MNIVVYTVDRQSPIGIHTIHVDGFRMHLAKFMWLIELFYKMIYMMGPNAECIAHVYSMHAKMTTKTIATTIGIHYHAAVDRKQKTKNEEKPKQKQNRFWSIFFTILTLHSFRMMMHRGTCSHWLYQRALPQRRMTKAEKKNWAKCS